MTKTHFIDGLLNRVKVREEALKEIKEYLHYEIGLPDPDNDNYDAISSVTTLFETIDSVLDKEDNQLSEDEHDFKLHIR